MTDRRLAALRALPELAPYTDRELDGLLGNLDEVAIGPGVRLATAGLPCHSWLVVLEGHVDACGRGGRRGLVEGDSAGWTAMWERGRNPETLVSASPVRLLVMGHAQFRALAALGRRGDLGPRTSSKAA